jgi:hypothetical protein
MVTEFVDLGVTVVTGGNAAIGTGGHDLIVFRQTVLQPRLLVAGLKKTAAPAAAVIVGAAYGPEISVFAMICRPCCHTLI